jgi:hypothetical protein
VVYADEVFKHLEANLEKALEVIHQGHNDIQQANKKNNQS